MSGENVEVVRRVFEAWNARDLDGVIALITPETEFVPLRVQLEGGSYRGPEGLHAYARDTAEEWEFLRILPDEFRDVGDRVLMLGTFDAHGRGSDMDIRVPVAMVMLVREGKILHLRTYADPQDALDALGLSE